MRTGIKIVLIVILLIVGVAVISWAKVASGQGSSSGPGPLGYIIAIPLLAGIRAIWKYNPDSGDNDTSTEGQDEDSDKHILDKN